VAAAPVRIGEADVYTGICSWADAEFVRNGNFYPRGVRSKPDARLRYVASQFPAVEVDATFFSLLSPAQATRWVNATPAGFLFSVKAFGLFTGQGADPNRLPPGIRAMLPAEFSDAPRVHHGDVPSEAIDACWAAWLSFVDVLAAAGRLGYLLFQFPARFRYARAQLAVVAEIAERLAGRRAAVEFRHRSWVEDRAREHTLGALRDLGFAYVVPDEPQLAWTMPPEVHVTADWAVLRLHGRNYDEWYSPATGDYMNDYEYSDDELRAWAARLREIGSKTNRIYASFNNFPRMARSAARLIELLEGRGAARVTSSV